MQCTCWLGHAAVRATGHGCAQCVITYADDGLRGWQQVMFQCSCAWEKWYHRDSSAGMNHLVHQLYVCIGFVICVPCTLGGLQSRRVLSIGKAIFRLIGFTYGPQICWSYREAPRIMCIHTINCLEYFLTTTLAHITSFVQSSIPRTEVKPSKSPWLQERGWLLAAPGITVIYL